MGMFGLAAAGFVLGWMSCARIGRPAVEARDRYIADLEMERDRWQRHARHNARRRIMDAISQPRDDGERLFREIELELHGIGSDTRPEIHFSP